VPFAPFALEGTGAGFPLDTFTPSARFWSSSRNAALFSRSLFSLADADADADASAAADLLNPDPAAYTLFLRVRKAVGFVRRAPNTDFCSAAEQTFAPASDMTTEITMYDDRIRRKPRWTETYGVRGKSAGQNQLEKTDDFSVDTPVRLDRADGWMDTVVAMVPTCLDREGYVYFVWTWQGSPGYPVQNSRSCEDEHEIHASL